MLLRRAAAHKAINASVSLATFMNAAAPLIWAQIADARGRRITYLLALPVAIVASILGFFAQNVAVFYVTRIFQQIGMSAVLVAGSVRIFANSYRIRVSFISRVIPDIFLQGTLSDITHSSSRSQALGLFYLGYQGATTLAPAIGGVIADAVGWRWTFLVSAGYTTCIFAAVFFFLPETMDQTVMRANRAKGLRNPLAPLVYSEFYLRSRISCSSGFGVSMCFALAFADVVLVGRDMADKYPFVLAVVIQIAFTVMLLYIFQVTVPHDFVRVFSFTTAQVGFAQMVCGLSYFVCTWGFGVNADRTVKVWRGRRGGIQIPEFASMDDETKHLVGLEYFRSRSMRSDAPVYTSGRAEPLRPVPEPGQAVFPRFAASLLICVPREGQSKDQEEDYEVLIQLRGSRGFFGSLTVFPGGALDASDGDPEWRELFRRSIAANVPQPGPEPEAILKDFEQRFPLSAAVASLREAFEEVGVFMSTDPRTNRNSDRALDENRLAVYNQTASFRSLFATERNSDILPVLPVPWHHFVTPATEPTRYSARFLLTTLPKKPLISADGSETVTAYWSTPSSALSRLERGEIRMVEPQFVILTELKERFPNFADLVAYSTYRKWRDTWEVADTVPEYYRDPSSREEVLTMPGDVLHSDTDSGEISHNSSDSDSDKHRNRVVLHPADPTASGMGGNLGM
ncbi:hypothetical protein HDU93_007818 [Gonapodya sp. JEL0774]|nr:hypothetical protein HDU93_007818 [Gonapodya sp. JEL0774]